MARGNLAGVISGLVVSVVGLSVAALTFPPRDQMDAAGVPETAAAVTADEGAPAAEPAPDSATEAEPEPSPEETAETEPEMAEGQPTGDVAEAAPEPAEAPAMEPEAEAEPAPATMAEEAMEPTGDEPARPAPSEATGDPLSPPEAEPDPGKLQAPAQAPSGPAPGIEAAEKLPPASAPAPRSDRGLDATESDSSDAPSTPSANATTAAAPEPAPAPEMAEAPDVEPTPEPEPAPEQTPEAEPDPAAEAAAEPAAEPEAEIPTVVATPAPAPRKIVLDSEAEPEPEPAPEPDAPETVVTDRLPSIGDAPAEPEAATVPGVPAIDRNGLAFDATGDLPLLSLLLLDTGDRLDLAANGGVPFPVTVAVDAGAADAQETIDYYRGQGAEVALMLPLPDGATPADVDVTVQAYGELLGEAAEVVTEPELGFQALGTGAVQLATNLAESGHGLVSFPAGLNTGHKAAVKEGVPAGLVFLDLDGEGQGGPVIRRFLDNAAFRARNENGVIVIARTKPETLEALLEWSTMNRAQTVRLAPVSAVLKSGSSGG